MYYSNLERTLQEDAVCFQDKLELELALNDYLMDNSPDTDVAKTYGWPINAWCVDDVQDFSYLFSPTTNILKASFQERLSNWNMSGARTVESMFEGNEYYAQDVSSWNLSSCINFSRMFFGAESFTSDLCRWASIIPETANITQMFRGTSCPIKADPNIAFGGPWCFECPEATLSPSTSMSPSASMNPTTASETSRLPTMSPVEMPVVRTLSPTTRETRTASSAARSPPVFSFLSSTMAVLLVVKHLLH